MGDCQSNREWQREGIELPGVVSAGGRSKAPPLDKHPQCVSQVRTSAKLLNRLGVATQSETGATSADTAQQLQRGRQRRGKLVTRTLLAKYS